MPAWAPPLIAAGGAIALLNLALAIRRLRERYGAWAVRTAIEIKRWDGLLPDDLAPGLPRAGGSRPGEAGASAHDHGYGEFETGCRSPVSKRSKRNG